MTDPNNKSSHNPPDLEAGRKRLWQLLCKSECHVYLTSHHRTDGDGLGAVIGFSNILNGMGSETTAILDSEIPQVYQFLPGCEKVRKPQDIEPRQGSIVIILDSADLDRIGASKSVVQVASTVVTIDHHVSNDGFGDIVRVDDLAGSTCEMVYDFANEYDIGISRDAATALYTGIITDTGRFCHSNTTESCLMAASHLVRLGADPAEIGMQVYKNCRYSVMRLQSLAMQTIRLHFSDRVATMELCREMFEETGTSPVDVHEFVDIAAGIQGVDVGLLFRYMPETGGTKVSLRSTGGFDVSAVAARFGGGGHINAAGCELDMPVNEAKEAVLNALKQDLE